MNTHLKRRERRAPLTVWARLHGIVTAKARAPSAFFSRSHEAAFRFGYHSLSQVLTLQSGGGKSNGKVVGSRNSYYAQARLRTGVHPFFHESGATPPEHLLQVVWYHQRLIRDQLCTVDGRRLRVLHPGFWNREAGPDFRAALLQFDDDPPVTGDVEIDVAASGWILHRHQGNPAYRQVVLHVVWKNDHPTDRPTLILGTHLDAPLEELAIWLGKEEMAEFPFVLAGQCCAPLRELTEDQICALLRQAALVRLEAKGSQLQARARQAGWEQALWEGMFRALGYKHNVWPLQRLAELRTRLLQGSAPGVELLQARLFGLGQLLDVPAAFSKGNPYLRRVWDYWWRDREAYADCLLPRALWRFHGLRPANHPERRLALASHWLTSQRIIPELERWCLAKLRPRQLLRTLWEILRVDSDEFWDWHWTLHSPRLQRAQPLLGATRVTDLAVNVILPWLWVRAREGRNEKLQEEMAARYFAWGAGQDNSVLKLARDRLLGGVHPASIEGAAAQQGLLQIVRDFCDHSNSLCANCQFPQVVRGWSSEAMREPGA